MDDILNYILNPESEKDGLLKKESEAYRDMMSGSWNSNEKTSAESSNIIELYVVTEEPAKKHPADDKIVYAADSGDEIDKPLKKTYFFISKNNHYILKIDGKKEFGNRKVNASLICTDKTSMIKDCLLYCNEIKKHYIIDCDNEINLGNFSETDFTSFRFSLVAPKAKISLLFNKDKNTDFNVTAASDNKALKIIDAKTMKGNLLVEIKSSICVRTLVFSNNIYSDFLNLKENKIIIPEKLLAIRSRILVY